MNRLIKLLLLTFFLFSSAIGTGQENGENLDITSEVEQGFFDDEEEAPPPEAPYFDAEAVEISKEKRKRRAKLKKKKRPTRNNKTSNDKASPKPPSKLSVDQARQGRVRKRYIEHPNAAKGLYKITKDGTYLYKVRSTKKKAASSVRFGLFDAPNFLNGDTGASFSDIYGGSNLIVFIDYEWPKYNWLPNLSLKVGSGIMIASGNGRLDSTPSQTSEETFSLIMLPNHGSLVYRFKFWKNQWLVPYAEGGGGLFLFNESRDDGQPPLGRFGLAATAHIVGGVAFSLTRFAKDTALRLDAQYGINDVALTAEVRQLIGFGTFDLTSTVFSGGITVQF